MFNNMLLQFLYMVK